jgi:hypothetical protein
MTTDYEKVADQNQAAALNGVYFRKELAQMAEQARASSPAERSS